jgi:hypothetical protein
MMLVRFANIDMTIAENEEYWTWLTILVKNS